MLFRSISKHVKDQNWFAVLIDFVIVVVGVFIGIQVANWNAARTQAEAERQLLSRLTVEMTALEIELEQNIKTYTKLRNGTGLVIDTIRSKIKPENESNFKEALVAANTVSDVPAKSASYVELVSSGGLSRISNPDIRDSLVRYGSFHDINQRSYNAAQLTIFNADSNYFRAVSWSTNDDDWSDPETAITSYDWDTLLDSEAELQAWIVYQSDSLRNVKGMHGAVEDLLVLLNEEAK